MTIVLVIGLCNSLLYNARIGYENTYYMREILQSSDRKTIVILSVSQLS